MTGAVRFLSACEKLDEPRTQNVPRQVAAQQPWGTEEEIESRLGDLWRCSHSARGHENQNRTGRPESDMIAFQWFGLLCLASHLLPFQFSRVLPDTSTLLPDPCSFELSTDALDPREREGLEFRVHVQTSQPFKRPKLVRQ